MKIKVDTENDALYFRLDDSKVVDSEEIRPGVILDYNTENQVIGLELLNISSRVSQEDLSSIQFQHAV